MMHSTHSLVPGDKESSLTCITRMAFADVLIKRWTTVDLDIFVVKIFSWFAQTTKLKKTRNVFYNG